MSMDYLAPIKPLSVPWFELQAAVLEASLWNFIKTYIKIDIYGLFKIFVAHRLVLKLKNLLMLNPKHQYFLHIFNWSGMVRWKIIKY